MSSSTRGRANSRKTILNPTKSYSSTRKEKEEKQEEEDNDSNIEEEEQEENNDDNEEEENNDSNIEEEEDDNIEEEDNDDNEEEQEQEEQEEEEEEEEEESPKKSIPKKRVLVDEKEKKSKPGKAERNTEIIVLTRSKPKSKKILENTDFQMIIDPVKSMYPDMKEKEMKKLVNEAFAESNIPMSDNEPDKDIQEPFYIYDTRDNVKTKIEKLIDKNKINKLSKAKIEAYSRIITNEIMLGTKYNNEKLKEMNLIKEKL